MTEDTNLAVDEMKEIIDDFLIEADELINSLDTNLVTLESKPDDLELLNGIFRAAHTIKGTSSFLGFEQVTSLTHKMEDILNRLRKAELKVTPEIMDVLLESVDILKVLMENVRSGNTEYVDLESILARLVTANEGTSPVTTESKTTDSTRSTKENPTPEDSPVVTALTEDKGAVEEEGDDQPAAARKAVSTAPGKSVDSQTIRVDVERLDSLMNLSGELVLSRNGLLQTINMMNKSGEANALTEQFNRAAANLNYITTELQLAVMKMRMQPIGKVFSKFPRLVRDLSREMHKNIELTIQGETTELDKSVIEEIGDPLVHIVRNSCDHGIETPEERVAKGKPATGHVIMSASQEGSNIVIKVSDDGKGLDVSAIRAKAVERGMISEFDAGRISDREAFKFIFAAGLSTAKVVTDVSGRGVGMDRSHQHRKIEWVDRTRFGR
jgi:two-component system chemotaxis sensor kinase CheA